MEQVLHGLRAAVDWIPWAEYAAEAERPQAQAGDPARPNAIDPPRNFFIALACQPSTA
jgi:hypothetical protein